MLRSMSAAICILLFATVPSRAEPNVSPRGKPEPSADGQRDRRDGVMTPPPPLCDEHICDVTKPFRFHGRMVF